MKSFNYCFFAVMLLIAISCNNAEVNDSSSLHDFVPVKGLQFESQGRIINLSDFEILDHPVTNTEYKAFIDNTKYTAPLHWEKGRIPKGKEDYPVIFVNRDDVEAYTGWLTQITGRIHRIPTPFEFEIAARGGKKSGDRYFWGNDEELLTTENINFNESLDRKYDQWKEYLKPSRWGLKNEIGLYQMTGNVWQLAGQNEDPLLAPWIFRIEKPLDRERLIMGGSWISTKDFLICGKTVNQPPGIRCPDLGIRIVREPEGAKWTIKNRKVTAVTHSYGKVGISWAFLDSDTKDTRFNIYRIAGNYRSHKGVKLNAEPLVYTSFVDEADVKDSTRYQYRVITVDSNGKEGNPSDWASVIAGSDKYPVAVKFKPVFEKGDMLPVFGDLEGYGKLNCVIRLDNGCKEMSQDPG
ncbi:MAG: SUMF1/EgtB/PvdO family nonheme iron enzyme, partial [Bacteroidota bacterium]|nr:SUMF1/EgtB/PvdO family nonheme iron enzyme [Bacteroidota bacterium]